MSDHNERPCQKCGSLTHHENDCNDDRLRQENERLKGEVEEPHNDQIWHLTQERDSARGTVSMWLEANGPGGWIDNLRADIQRHKQALEVARGYFKAVRDFDDTSDFDDPGQIAIEALTTINNVLKEGK